MPLADDRNDRAKPGIGLWLPASRILLALLAALGVVAIAGLALAPRFFLPAEDAVILYQYSYNLAHHGAITYFAGGPHTEGATDFAWMLLVAAAMRLGLEPFVFTAIVNVGCVLGLAFVLPRLAGLRVTPTRGLIVAGAMALMPQMIAAVAGFAVLPDALLLALLVFAVVRERVRLAATMALLLCLFRPDGVVFAIPLLFSLLLPRASRWSRATAVAMLFVLPGAIYFAWRAHYFGELFPLPFLVKSDTPRILGLVVAHTFRQSTKYLLFAAALLIPTFFRGRRPFETLSLLCSLVLVPTLFYWAMRLDQNVGDRFFFYLPLAAALLLALSWPRLDRLTHHRVLGIGLAAWLLLLLGPLLREIRTFRDFQFRDQQAIARALGQLPQRGVLLTTEAGFLAYESHWIAYDAWGLNTARFARHLIQPADVAALQPDLIVMHPDLPEGPRGDARTDCSAHRQPGAAVTARAWPNMTRNLIAGANDAGGYELWLLSYGSEYYRRREHWHYADGDRECIFVRSASPLAPGIRAALAAHHAKTAADAP